MGWAALFNATNAISLVAWALLILGAFAFFSYRRQMRKRIKSLNPAT